MDPEETAAVVEETPDAPTHDQPGTDPAPAEAAAAVETADPPKPEPKYADWREALKDADPEELLRDPRVAGRIGQVADRRARELAEQRIREAQAAQREAAERSLRDSDPYKYAEVKREQDRQRAAQQAESQRIGAIGTVVTQALADYAKEAQIPEDVLKAAAQEADGQPLDQGLKTWVAKTIDGSRDRWRKQWEDEEVPVLKKKWLAEQNGGEPSVQLGGGASGKGALDFSSEEEMAAAHMAGRITTDQARAWHTQRRTRR